MSEEKEEREDNLSRFARFLNIVRGKVDFRSRLRAILNPEKIETTTRLTRREIEFVNDAKWLYNQWPQVFEPLWNYAREFMYLKISEKGLGRREAIEMMMALEQGKLLKGLMLGVEPSPSLRQRLSEKIKGGEEK